MYRNIDVSERLLYAIEVRRMSRDSLVGTATSYGLNEPRVGVRVPVVKNFLFSMSFRPALGSTQPPIQ
jgi:hypothetical protein